MREPIELQDDEAGLVGVDGIGPAAGEGAHQRAVVGLILVKPEEQADGAGEATEDERDDERTQDATADGDGRHERVQQHDHERLQEQGQEQQGDDGAAGHQPQQHRSHQQVEGCDDDDRDQAATELVDVELWQQPGGDIEGDDAGDQRHQRPLDERTAAEPPVPQQLELRPIQPRDALHVVHVLSL